MNFIAQIRWMFRREANRRYAVIEAQTRTFLRGSGDMTREEAEHRIFQKNWNSPGKYTITRVY